MSDTPVIYDENRERILIGSRVIAEDNLAGTVVEITDMDGDVNDYGRAVMIPPQVKVRFDPGPDVETWKYPAYIDHGFSLDEFVCDDVRVVA